MKRTRSTHDAGFGRIVMDILCRLQTNRKKHDAVIPLSLQKAIGQSSCSCGVMGEPARLSSHNPSSWGRETDMGLGIGMGEAGYTKE
mgnify:CR=1 FL=1